MVLARIILFGCFTSQTGTALLFRIKIVNTSQNCLILFAKSPQQGKVKTRLEADLGKAATLQFYLSLLQKQVSLVESCSFATHSLWVDGQDQHQVFGSLAGKGHQQQGCNLGERMENALKSELLQFERVVLIGVDCPEMNISYIRSAFQSLKEKDVVLGPARDGGYVMIGFKNNVADIFDDIPWGTDQVLDSTLNKIEHLKLECCLLETLDDIDTVEDLEKFPELYPQ